MKKKIDTTGIFIFHEDQYIVPRRTAAVKVTQHYSGGMVVSVGMAVPGKKDIFCRRIGRAIAIGRLTCTRKQLTEKYMLEIPIAQTLKSTTDQVHCIKGILIEQYNFHFSDSTENQ
ncbi:MAG: hypothetical protein KGI50_06515 [Patescibacteria group bacterium]|nr:hypothetical protein [Patescibacteria group bacterium]MDE2439031.1 hypothetical protein [Patescibacteria group bacterium]